MCYQEESLTDTVYVLGAGINRNLSVTQRVDEGPAYQVRAPLASDFFQQLLRLRRVYREEDFAHHVAQYRALYDYVERYWKLKPQDLRTTSFDLEACYTLIQLQLGDAIREDNREELQRLWEVQGQLTTLLRALLAEFQTSWYAESAEGVRDMRILAQLIEEQHAAVLTFNYDTILEEAREFYSEPQSPIEYNSQPQDHYYFAEGYDDMRHSHYRWNRALAYGVKFDEVHPYQSGPPPSVPGPTFYDLPENQLYDPPLLKLHGSTDWHAYTGYRRDPMSGGFQPAENYEELRGRTVLSRSLSSSAMGSLTHRFDAGIQPDGLILEPLIIAPVLYKNYDRRPFPEIWRRARDELSGCSRLIVGGFSFAPTDFPSRRLFLEAFADHVPDELVVINPNTDVVHTVRDLCHFQKPISVCRDLGEFIRAEAARRQRGH